MRVSREELYEQVWAEPMLKVAERYGVSSSFLGRVCGRMNIPRPPRGYWAKLKVGGKSQKPALPSARACDDLEWTRGYESRRARRVLPASLEKAPRRRQHRNSELPSTHELVRGARTHFDKVRVSEAGYLRPTKRLLLDVFVSKDTLEWALECANSLYLSLESRGHKVSFAPAK